MRLLFVNWAFENHGSAQDLHNYTQLAREMGHEIALYGVPSSSSAFRYSLDVNAADAVIFLFEFTTHLQYGDRYDWLRLVGRVPRRRRVIIDCDGKYNDVLAIVGDGNHPDAQSARRWIEVCDSLSDKIYQPTVSPLRANVGSFLFHAYNPTWETPLNGDAKEYGMVYVGNNWFRWRALEQILRAIEPIRQEIKRIALVGQGWSSSAPWGGPMALADAYRTDPAYLRQMAIDVLPPVRFDEVVAWMGKGVFSPVIYRPLFDRLRLVTCRTFETPAANTIPLFAQPPAFVAQVYGDEAVELVLPETRPDEKIADLLRRPTYYAARLAGIRQRLAEKHSYTVRLRELLQIIQN